jgi:hypothetical protein
MRITILNKTFMMNLPTTVNDSVVVKGLVNIIDKATHFDKHTGNISLLSDPILITDSIQVIDSDTITIMSPLSVGFLIRKNFNIRFGMTKWEIIL